MILSGVVASSAGGLIATGGNETYTANGYRHHFFFSSGTLNVVGSGPIKILTQDGGLSGTFGFQSFSQMASGAGGASGANKYIDGIASGNLTVTVAGAGGTSSVSGFTQTGVTEVAARNGGRASFNTQRGWQAQTYSSFCIGFCEDPWTGNYYCCQFGYYWQITDTPISPVEGHTHSSISSIYSGAVFEQYTFTTRAGGGGGIGGMEFFGGNYSYETRSRQAGANTGGGAGAINVSSGGSNALSLSGGGGGGGAAFASMNGGGNLSGPGTGGSGLVIVSYPV